MDDVSDHKKSDSEDADEVRFSQEYSDGIVANQGKRQKLSSALSMQSSDKELTQHLKDHVHHDCPKVHVVRGCIDQEGFPPLEWNANLAYEDEVLDGETIGPFVWLTCCNPFFLLLKALSLDLQTSGSSMIYLMTAMRIRVVNSPVGILHLLHTSATIMLSLKT
jgi:hypothetical protein